MKNNISILVVDDSLQNLSVLGNTLRKNGYNVVASKSGEYAIEYLQNVTPDLILLDIMMDGMDGFEVCNKIKQNNKLKDIPIIFLTAKTSEKYIIKGFEHGAVDYITKPFIITEVLARIENHLKIKNFQRVLDNKNKILKRQQQVLTKNYKKLQKLIKFKEKFTAMVVHDLRNPLNSIITYSNDERINAAANQMLILVSNMIIIQKFEQAKVELNYSLVLLQKLISEALRQTKYLQQSNSIKVINDIPDDIYIRLDFELMLRVLINLISNAIKYSYQGGEIQINAKKQQNTIEIEVVDFGKGISKEMSRKIFEDYFTGNTINNNASIGLGLTFSKLIVEAHEGTIDLFSEVEKKTVFTIKLPYTNNKINNITTQPKIDNAQSTNIVLDAEEMNVLKPYTRKMKNIAIYEISRLNNIINEMEEQSFTPNQKKWLDNLKKSINYYNENRYKLLISQINEM